MDVRVINEKFDAHLQSGIGVFPVFSHFEGEMLGSHWHEELEVVYTVYGNNIHVIDGESFRVSPGELVVVNSGFVHSIVPQNVPTEDSSLKALVIIVSTAFLHAVFPQYEEVYFTNKQRTATHRMDQIILDLVLCADQTNPSAQVMLHRNALFLELLSLLQDRTVRRETTLITVHEQSVEEIKKIIAYVEDNFDKPLTREYVANTFGLSPNYFSTYFKKYSGVTFSRYLKDTRLAKARKLLLTTNKSVGVIASECGFTDDRSLIVAFREKFHNTPLQFRKEQLNS